MENYENSYDDDVDLAQFDDDFGSAEVEDRDFDDVPDGKYQCLMERVELTHAKSSHNPMLSWTLKILGPKHKGRKLWRHNVMASKENIKWLKQDLYTCGLELQKLSDLPANLDKLLDVTVEVTKKTRGENENIYINRRITIAGDPEGQGEPVADDVPIVPF